MKTVIEWIDPKDHMPPFGERILVLLGGQGITDWMKTWQRYATITDAIITKSSPNDDDDETTEYMEFLREKDNKAMFQQYQFVVRNWSEWKFVGDSSSADWYSDAICMWAPMPDFSEAITAVEVAP